MVLDDLWDLFITIVGGCKGRTTRRYKNTVKLSKIAWPHQFVTKCDQVCHGKFMKALVSN